MLLNLVIKDCERLDKNFIRLEVDLDNDKGLSFYKKNGFIRDCAASCKSDYYILKLKKVK